MLKNVKSRQDFEKFCKVLINFHEISGIIVQIIQDLLVIILYSGFYSVYSVHS